MTATVTAWTLQSRSDRVGASGDVLLVPEILSGEVEAWWEILAWAFQRSRNRSIEWEDSRLQLDGPVQRRVVFERIAERLKVRNRVVRQEATEELVAALAPEGPRPALFLNWDGACRLPRGGFTIGSHSEFHAVLSQESPEEQRRDLLASRQRLQHELQVPVDLLAYPNGRGCNYDQNTVGWPSRLAIPALRHQAW